MVWTMASQPFSVLKIAVWAGEWPARRSATQLEDIQNVAEETQAIVSRTHSRLSLANKLLQRRCLFSHLWPQR